MRLRISMLPLVLLGLPALFFGATFSWYFLAAWAESLGQRAGFRGGGSLVNIVTLMLLTVMVFAALLTLAERKWSSMVQDRVGPNRASILGIRAGGIPHFVADAVKFLFKEDFTPERASKFLFSIAPGLVFVPAFLLFAVVPAAPPIHTTLHGFLPEPVTVSLEVARPDFGILFVFAFSSLAVYGVVLAGWASNNKLALLGAVRASSEMIAYEVALGLSIIGIVLAFNTLRLEVITAKQSPYLFGGGSVDVGLPAWGIFLQPIGFLLFFAAAFAETKRTPFDMPEGESEIVGFFLEYSGLRFGLFMIAEFVEIVVLAALVTVLFFGGFHLPFGERWLAGQIGPNWLAVVLGMVFWLKVLVLCWLQLMVRWTFPRFRYDHIQKLGWKMLLPLGLVNVFVSGALVLLDPSLKLLGGVGLAELAGLIILSVYRPAAVAPLPAVDPHASAHSAH